MGLMRQRENKYAQNLILNIIVELPQPKLLLKKLIIKLYPASFNLVKIDMEDISEFVF